MNIVDKILVDPITRGMKFFTKGGVPAYVTQVLGRTDGSSPAAGEIGEKISSSAISQTSTVSANTFIDVAGASLPLTKGIWLVHFTGQMRIRNVSGSIRNIAGKLSLTDSANNQISGGTVSLTNSSWPVSTDTTTNQSFTLNINITVDTTYKLRIQCNESNVNGIFVINTGAQAFDAFDCVPLFYAIRLP